MIISIAQLRALCGTDAVIYSKHFLDRCRQRNIRLADVESAILTGEIIEEYPEDYPFPSCLILGISHAIEYLHVVCSLGNNNLYMITTYKPTLDKWELGFKTRRKEKSL